MKIRVLLLCLLLIKLVKSQSAVTQIQSIVFTKPTDCNPNQYYDISRLSCENCPPNTTPSDAFNCRCNKNYYILNNYGGGQIQCARCLQGLIQSLDGYYCVSCDATCQNCPAGSYRSDTFVNGTYFPNFVSRCIFCDTDESFATSSSCVSCKPLIFPINANSLVNNTKCTDINNGVTNGGMLIDISTTTSNTNYPDPSIFTVVFDTNSVLSCYYSNYLLAVYRLCQDPNRRNSSACETLGNLCVLNLYSYFSSPGVDACKAFFVNIQNRPATTSNSFQSVSISFAPGMPWLQYLDQYGVLKNNYASLGTYDNNNKYITLSYEKKCVPSSELSFVAAQYTLNGTLKSFGKIDISRFQLCNYLSSTYSKASQVSPFVATNYVQKCKISVESLLEYGNNLIFYDVFLKYKNTSGIYPLPIIIKNYKDPANNENNINTNTADDIVFRRFFLVDSISGKPTDTKTPEKSCLSNQPQYIRYASSINLRFDLLSTTTTGTIYPPTFYIEYGYIPASELSQTVDVSFKIEYYMDVSSQVLAGWICVGVLCFLSIILAFFRIWIWNRRSGKLAPDMISLFKFLMFLSSGLANSFFFVVVGLTIYWLIFFKGQNVAFVVIPQPDQESNITIMILIAFVLKLVDVIHLIFTQTSYDIFFIDWERPKLDMSSDNNTLFPPIKKNEKSKSEMKESLIKDDYGGTESTKISCWRTLFVANEWNELQTFRKINPTIQLIFLLLFLKVVNLEAFTTSDCNASIRRDPNEYQAPYSSTLRVGMASAMYLGVGLLQYIFYLLFYIRLIEDKVGQFVDFCSISNISMFIMTHTQYGYYIHGRSPHGNADTNMQQMTEALQNEENNLTAKRGLEKDSDQQTFSISISDKLSRQYSKVMIPIYERKVKRTDTGAYTQTEFEKRMVAYNQLNKFLMAFINNILREMQYVITKRNFLENVLDFEFREPLLKGYFYADVEKSFERVIFFGQESKLFIFDLLIFLIVDYFAQNYVLAAFIVFLIVKLYEISRESLGERNISRKTLVDKRFLI